MISFMNSLLRKINNVLLLFFSCETAFSSFKDSFMEYFFANIPIHSISLFLVEVLRKQRRSLEFR